MTIARHGDVFQRGVLAGHLSEPPDGYWICLRMIVKLNHLPRMAFIGYLISSHWPTVLNCHRPGVIACSLTCAIPNEQRELPS